MEIDPLRNLARTARKVPGYRKLRRQLVPRIRRNKVARTLAHRIFGTGGGRRRGGADLTAGSVIDGIGTEGLPVALIIVANADETTCRAIADQAARAQLLSAGFKPLFLLDAPVFGPFRANGWAVDLVTARTDWHSEEQSYDEFVGCRIASLASTFATAMVVRAGSDGLAPIDQVVLSSMVSPTAVQLRR